MAPVYIWVSLALSGLGTVALFLAGFVLRMLRDDLIALSTKVDKDGKDIAAIKAWCKATGHQGPPTTSDIWP